MTEIESGKSKIIAGSSDCILWKVLSVGKKCRRTLLSAQYVKSAFTSGTLVTCRR